jgi:uncharacterized protein (DUF362 family)
MTHKKSRRDFLKASAGIAGMAAAGRVLPIRPLFAQDLAATAAAGRTAAAPMLAVVQGPAEAAVAKALELLGGMSRFVKPGAVVMVKPNVSFPNPGTWGTGSSPEAVLAVVKEALKAGAGRVIVADNTMRKGMESFTKTGLADALAGIDKVKILALQEESLFVEVPVPGGEALKAVKIAKLALKADVLINLPCAKSHTATEVSFGLKNNMGLIWDRSFFHTGTDIHAAIAELATVVRHHVTILDATRALLTNGPAGPGKVEALGLIIAGTDPLAVDAYATTLANWNNRTLKPRNVRHLELAFKLKVGEIDPSRMEIVKAGV